MLDPGFYLCDMMSFFFQQIFIHSFDAYIFFTIFGCFLQKSLRVGNAVSFTDKTLCQNAQASANGLRGFIFFYVHYLRSRLM